MKMGKMDSLIDAENLKHLGTMAGVITLVVVAFYVTGLVVNVKEIKKINKELKILDKK